MQGFNCPHCLKDASEAEEIGMYEDGIRVYRCGSCKEQFSEDEALTNTDVKEDIEADRADARNDELAMEDLPF